MNLTEKLKLLLIIGILVCSSDAYILRLPCTYQANFSVQHIDKYLVSNNPIKLYNISPQDCLFHCVQELTCTSINHRIDNSECELLTVMPDDLQHRVGWKYYVTDYKEALQVGAACKLLNPCGKLRQCKQTCSKPFYECIDLKNHALKKTAAAGPGSTFKIDKGPENAIDGKLSPICESIWKSNQYFRINLGKVYQIIYTNVEGIYNNLKYMNGFGIYIGNNLSPKQNKLFAEIQQTTTRKQYTNKNNVFIGKYIWIIRIESQKIILKVREIEAYGIRI